MKIDLPHLADARILVIGDVMLDVYWTGATRRISPEAPVPVVHVKGLENKPGGAANVAVNIATLGAHVKLLGLVGQDSQAAELERALDLAGVESCLVSTAEAQTISKLRVISQHQQLIRLDQEDGFAGCDHQPLLEAFSRSLAETDLVVLSDYAKGTLEPIVRELVAQARAAGKPVLVDPKGSDFDKYRGASIITPNMSEFTGVVGECASEAELQQKAEQLRQQTELHALLVTRSEKGMSLFEQGEQVYSLGAEVREVYDVTGAGDTVIAVLATALAAGASYRNAVRLANIAAGIVVTRLGAAAVTQEELRQAISSVTKQGSGRGVLTLEALLQQVTQVKARDEKVVFTNGCFDILHAGHVNYLSEARALGDRLIVAVNTDESVKKLKGDSRPINTLEDRMAVLAALECVDWVVPFAEETPRDLIAKILPDFLVKGGDYQPEDIAGFKEVTEAGGQVLTIELTEGRSTSNIIRKISAAE